MSLYIDDALNICGKLQDGETVELKQLICDLGERLNPESGITVDGCKRVDEARIKLLLLTSELYEWGTIVFGPCDELAKRQWAAQRGDVATALG